MNGIHLACLGAALRLRGLRILNNAICKCDAIVREPLAAVKNIGVEGRLVRDGVRKALAQRRSVIEDLVKAIGEYRKSGGDHQTVHALNKALERAELLLS